MQTENILIEIYSMIGEKLLHEQLPAQSRYELDLSVRAKGIYLVRVIKGDEIGVEKIVKQ